MKKGFTLIELLMVVLIIGILTAAALPQYRKAVERARATEAVLLLNTFMKAADAFILENPDLSLPQQDFLEVLGIDVNLLSKYKSWSVSSHTVCGSYAYKGCTTFDLTVTDNLILHLRKYRGSKEWTKTCTYKNQLAKSVCEGLEASGYQPNDLMPTSGNNRPHDS